MTSLPSPLGSPLLMTKHPVYDTQQGEFKRRVKQRYHLPLIQHPRTPKARGKQKGEKSQSFKNSQMARRKTRVKLKNKRRMSQT
ncbi:uncharacterized protein G2W53_039632 [Senna tora]|uniref:Uncharacterized protein n=1 Tax=Senna tora TaxID=362788 RepID=A0A834W6B5_9FABA|nr:uncharacterized protein G2W53_039632 [Senna tora]